MTLMFYTPSEYLFPVHVCSPDQLDFGALLGEGADELLFVVDAELAFLPGFFRVIRRDSSSDEAIHKRFAASDKIVLVEES
jgi:hypothetical protein